MELRSPVCVLPTKKKKIGEEVFQILSQRKKIHMVGRSPDITRVLKRGCTILKLFEMSDRIKQVSQCPHIGGKQCFHYARGSTHRGMGRSKEGAWGKNWSYRYRWEFSLSESIRCI